MNRHIGNFKISQTLFEDYEKELMKLFADMLPIRVEYLVAYNQLDCTAISPKYFEIVEEGYKIPVYTLSFNTTNSEWNIKREFNE